MSRSGSGTYSLPTGNPVVTETSISSTTHNATMADLAAEVTDSLSRTGKGGMLAAFGASDGSVSAPGLSFVSDPDTGFYRTVANAMSLAIGGVEKQSWSSTLGHLSVRLTITASADSGIGVLEVTNSNAIAGEAIRATSTGDGTAIRAYSELGAGIETFGRNGAGIFSICMGSGTALVGTSVSGYGANLSGNATKAALRLVPQASAPSSASEGDIYVDSTTHKLCVYLSGSWVAQT